jgi:hypothetical protein
MKVGNKYDYIDSYRIQYTLTVLSFNDKEVVFSPTLKDCGSELEPITVTIERLNEQIKKNNIQLMD